MKGVVLTIIVAGIATMLGLAMMGASAVIAIIQHAV
jgi:hypothetical protein